MNFSSFFDYDDPAAATSQSGFQLLPHWDDSAWARFFSYTETLRYAAGAEVIRPGEHNRSLYIVDSGQLEVLISRQGRHQRLALIETGSVFGEQAFFDGRPRSARVRALSDCQLLRLGLEQFQILSAKEGELARDLLFDLGRLLSQRLRDTTQLLTGKGV